MQLAEGNLQVVAVDEGGDEFIDGLAEEHGVIDGDKTLSHGEAQIHADRGVRIGEENLLAALGCALEVAQERESGREAEGVSLLGQRLPGSLFLQLTQVGVVEVKHRFIHKSHWGIPYRDLNV